MCIPNLHVILTPLLYRLSSRSAGLEIVTGDQPNPAISAVDLGLPPAVVLVPEDGEDVALREAELLRDGCRIHVERSRCIENPLATDHPRPPYVQRRTLTEVEDGLPVPRVLPRRVRHALAPRRVIQAHRP